MAPLSGRILVRTDGGLHQRLLIRAKANQQSLNELCLDRLSGPSTLEGTRHQIFRNILAAADILLGQELLGVVFFGSQARGEGRLDSDWDLLVVSSSEVALSRDIYRQWDKCAQLDEKNEIEVHFVHLPLETSIATGFWSEIALDGIVLFEKDFCVSKYLARVRREIAEGLILRKTKHGQSYWVHKELV